jgi:hypothetical protein
MLDYPALIRTMVAALAPDFRPGQLAQGRQDSNLQPAVLETAALPIAPLPYGVNVTPTTIRQLELGRTPSSVFSTPVNQSTQHLHVRKTGPFGPLTSAS